MPRDLYSPQADAEPGYCPGFWYHIAAGQVVAGAGLAVNIMRFLPFQVRALVDVVALGARITTLAVGGFCSFAVYRANGNTLLPVGRPVASTGPIATDLAVNVSGAITQGRAQLSPGMHWFGVQADNATVIFQTITNAQNSSFMGAPTQDGISSAAAAVVTYRNAAAQTFAVWGDLTDPITTAANVGNAHCLGQFQVAQAS